MICNHILKTQEVISEKPKTVLNDCCLLLRISGIISKRIRFPSTSFGNASGRALNFIFFFFFFFFFKLNSLRNYSFIYSLLNIHRDLPVLLYHLWTIGAPSVIESFPECSLKRYYMGVNRGSCHGRFGDLGTS